MHKSAKDKFEHCTIVLNRNEGLNSLRSNNGLQSAFMVSGVLKYYQCIEFARLPLLKAYLLYSNLPCICSRKALFIVWDGRGCIMANTGFRIYTDFLRPTAEQVEQFRGIAAANIADEMNRLSCMDARLKPINEVALLGTAVTVKVRSGDNLMIHRALDMAQPGDVVVVDGQGDLSRALVGELMLCQAVQRKLAGLIIDGAIRDLAALRKLPIAIYAAGATPNGPFKYGPGEVNVPISCGGIVVHPGDILVGDADGVVVVRPQEADALARKAAAKAQSEQQTLVKIAAGTRDRSAYGDAAFEARGCEIIRGRYAQ